MEIIQSPAAWLENPLCPNCLGRGFAKLGHGISNLERGNIIIQQLGINSKVMENITPVSSDESDGFEKSWTV
jgi:tRNA U54 and U55 pseudouridine synthase Pus10